MATGVNALTVNRDILNVCVCVYGDHHVYDASFVKVKNNNGRHFEVAQETQGHVFRPLDM